MTRELPRLVICTNKQDVSLILLLQLYARCHCAAEKFLWDYFFLLSYDKNVCTYLILYALLSFSELLVNLKNLTSLKRMGIYPMLLDETCFFLAADFDKASWTEDATAFLKTCFQMGLPAALERSRSGKGAHVWLFFSEAITASLARKLGSHILTETMERRPDIGLDSYDRLFPNQDTLPKGGFGNLIALPLQKKARNLGNSVFIASDFNPHPDQWQFLSMIRRMPVEAAEEIVPEAQSKGDLVGVRQASDEDTAEP